MNRRASCLCWHRVFVGALLVQQSTAHVIGNLLFKKPFNGSREKQLCDSYSSCILCAANANSPNDLAIPTDQKSMEIIGECPMLSSCFTVEALCEACFSVQTVTMAPARVLLEWILSQSRVKKQQRIKDAASWKDPSTSHYVTSWTVWRRLLVKWESFFPEKLPFFSEKNTTMDLLWKKEEKNHRNHKITFLSSEAQARKRIQACSHTIYIYMLNCYI